MKQARVRIQVIKVYDITVEVGDGASEGDAVSAAYEMQTTEIQEFDSLQDAETDHAEFQEWVS